MTIGSLFSGIGGLELGLEWARLGHTIWQVEKADFPRSVLAKHWPGVDRSVTDVREVALERLPRVDVICGGFPCQDVSGAGRGAGLAGERSGLWFEYLRIVKLFQPYAVVVENVTSGAKRWLCAVRRGLQDAGYRTRALGIGARDVGAPHRRGRIFVLALRERISDAERVELRQQQGEGCWKDRARASELGTPRARLADADGLRRLQPSGSLGDERGRAGMGDAYSARLSFGSFERSEQGSELPSALGLLVDASGARCRRGSGHAYSSEGGRGEPSDASEGEAQPIVGGSAHGVSDRMDRRWPAGRGAEQFAWEPPRTVVERDRSRRPRLKAIGNAVVPACAELAGSVLIDWIAAQPFAGGSHA